MYDFKYWSQCWSVICKKLERISGIVPCILFADNSASQLNSALNNFYCNHCNLCNLSKRKKFHGFRRKYHIIVHHTLMASVTTEADGQERTVRGVRGIFPFGASRYGGGTRNPEPSYGERFVLLTSKFSKKIIIFVLILSHFTSSCEV